jgi:MYXO-CTERM domain-containing protein
MRLTLSVIIAAAALGVTPAAAQNADNATNTAVAAPAPTDNSLAATDNITAATPEAQTVAPVDTTAVDNGAATTPAPARKSRLPWGLVGLLGLVGLFGRRRSS